MRSILTAFCLCFFSSAISQNVGIGNSNPQEKLDVNGNINVTGTIKANGVAGQNGQVLKTNSSGNIEWSNPSAYTYFTSFQSTGAFSWTVPAGVTKVLVEVYGAGGGGGAYGSGAGGGCVRAWFEVTPGSSVTGGIGAGGSGGTTSSSGGVSSTVTIGGYTVNAFGGQGISYTAITGTMASTNGGSGNVTPAYQNYMVIRGGSGKPNKRTYQQSGANQIETYEGADGGDAGNTNGTGGAGGYLIVNVTSGVTSFRANPSYGSSPGGGGGASPTNAVNGGFGGDGRVIIWY